jgi:soluble lytic murein transglycosylase
VRLLSSAEVNLHLGARHLATLLERYDGRVVPALAAYNAGSRPVDRWLRYPEAGDSVQFVERIPYVETRGYVRSVLRNRSLYQALYPDVAESTDVRGSP